MRQADLDGKQRVCKQIRSNGSCARDRMLQNNSLNHEMPIRFRDETIYRIGGFRGPPRKTGEGEG